MSNLDVTDSEREETPNSSSTDAKKKPKGSMNRRNAKDVPEYEKQRLSRIAENKKRMEALGLAKLATSFLDSSMDLRKIDRKGKRKLGEAADEDYKPGNDSSSSEDDDSEEEDEDFGSGKVSGSRGMKVSLSIFCYMYCTFYHCTDELYKFVVAVLFMILRCSLA